MASVIETGIRNLVKGGVMALADRNRKRLPVPEAHPFATGIHRPVTREETLFDLAVLGQVPPELSGQYVRNGPNPLGDFGAGSYHWFLGDAMVHGVRLGDGRASVYRNRWVRSSAVSEKLGEPVRPGPRARSDNANTNVVGMGGRIFAIVEAGGHPVELSPDLETIAHNPFDGTLKGAYSAHPHLCPATGEWHSICYDPEQPDTVTHVVVSPDARVIREEPVAMAGGVSVHDCQVTATRVLLFDLPVTFSMKAAVAGWQFPLRWNPEHKARVGLLPRAGRSEDVVWCEVEPCYVFHAGNAFDDGDRVVVDVVVHDSMFAHSGYGPDSRKTTFERWTLDPAAGRVDRRILCDRPQEFPRYDERLSTSPCRFVWTTGLRPAQHLDLGTQLIRHDLTTGASLVRDFGPGRYPGEFVFVPRGAGETDGWLMGYVLDEGAGASELVILDAGDFAGDPVATVRIPVRIPPGFHGNWIAD